MVSVFYDTIFGSTAVKGAWGPRKMVSAYSGPVLRVRDGTTNAEQDVYATGPNGKLDAVAGASSFFVTTLYDQSGNGADLVQSTNAAQPLLLQAYTGQGHAALSFDAVSQYMLDGVAGTDRPYMIAKPLYIVEAQGGTVTTGYANLMGTPHIEGGTGFPYMRVSIANDNTGPSYNWRTADVDGSARVSASPGNSDTFPGVLVYDAAYHDLYGAGPDSDKATTRLTTPVDATYPNSTRLHVGAGASGNGKWKGTSTGYAIIDQAAHALTQRQIRDELEAIAIDVRAPAAYSYWKLRPTEMFTSGVSAAEWYLRNTVGGANIITPSNSNGSATQFNASQIAAYALDGNDSTYWGAAGTGIDTAVYRLALTINPTPVEFGFKNRSDTVGNAQFTQSKLELYKWYTGQGYVLLGSYDWTAEGYSLGQVYTGPITYPSTDVAANVSFDYAVELGKSLSFDYSTVLGSSIVGDYKIDLARSLGFDYGLELGSGVTFDYSVFRGTVSEITFDYAVSVGASIGSAYGIELGAALSFDYGVELSRSVNFDYVLDDSLRTDLTSSYRVQLGKSLSFDYRSGFSSSITFDYGIAVEIVAADLSADYLINTTDLSAAGFMLVPESPLTERWMFETTMAVSRDGSEQRAALRTNPRVQLDYNFVLTDERERRTMFELIYRRSPGIYLVPQYAYGVNITAAAVAGDSVVYCDPEKADVRAGDFIYTMTPDGETGAFALVSSVGTGSVFLAFPIELDLPAGSWLMLALEMRASDGSGLSMSSISGTVALPFDAMDNRRPVLRPGTPAAVATFDGLPLIEQRHSADDAITDLFVSGAVTLDEAVDARKALFSPWLSPKVGGARSYRFDRRNRINYWREFADLVKGQRSPFLVCSYRDDLIPAAGNVAGNELIVTGSSYLDMTGREAFSRIQIEAGGAVSNHKINAVAQVAGGLRLTLDTAYSDPDISRVSFLNLVRLNSDTITLTHDQLYSVISFSVRTVDA